MLYMNAPRLKIEAYLDCENVKYFAIFFKKNCAIIEATLIGMNDDASMARITRSRDDDGGRVVVRRCRGGGGIIVRRRRGCCAVVVQRCHGGVAAAASSCGVFATARSVRRRHRCGDGGAGRRCGGLDIYIYISRRTRARRAQAPKLPQVPKCPSPDGCARVRWWLN